MRDVLKDENFRKLLKEKQKYEMFSWVIPLISIFSLIIILFLTSKNDLTEFTIVVLVLLIFLIIGGYIYDNKITIKIHQSYSRLNEYFQDIIVPQLLVRNNPTINFNDKLLIDSKLLDDVEIFNNYTNYKSQYNYTGQMNGHQFSFHEVLFFNQVEYDTTGQKEVNEDIFNEVNYHWYTFTLNKEYPTEAIYLLSKFVNYHKNLFKNFQRFDFNKHRLHFETDFELYLKDLKEFSDYATNDIVKALSDDSITSNSTLAIYIKGNELHIIIEEIDDLISLSHSNKIVIESLLKGYYDEQELIKFLVNVFDK